jgi:hypothetical protein
MATLEELRRLTRGVVDERLQDKLARDRARGFGWTALREQYVDEHQPTSREPGPERLCIACTQRWPCPVIAGILAEP